MAITALPTPPTRDDPDNFVINGDVFLAALPTFVTEVNALAVTVDSQATSVLNAAALAYTLILIGM